MRKLTDMLDELDDLHSEIRDFAHEVERLIEDADRYAPDGEDMDIAQAGEWIHRGDLIQEIQGLIG